MKRSLFLAFLLRLALGLGALAVLWYWLPGGLLRTLASLLAAVVLAWLCSRTVANAVSPLTAALNRKTDISQEPVSYAELDTLALALHIAVSETAQQRAEMAASRAQLETILDSMGDAVVAVDPAGRIQWTNAPLRRLLPGTPESGAVRVGHALVQTIRDPEVLACVDTALREGTACEKRSVNMSPGRIFTVQATPMPHGGAVAVLHDITQIEGLERMQRDLVANVSHELRTPLTSITGYVETLLDDVEGEGISNGAGKDFLSRVLKNATRMNSLVEDLLVLARVESGRHALNPRPVQASLLVQEAFEATAGLLRDSNSDIEVGEVTELEVLADMDAVIRVLSNLIENALKYGATNGGGRVVVSAEQDTRYPNSVRFSVRDFGAGIASEHIGRLFERFYRVDKARSRESGGTGLGLAIARRLTEAQNGRIWCESELNQGSTFFFTLPIAS
ncbi:MAG TPA: ATP-binding protein [Acidobacteriaceae bacterium]|jgi:two-component system phosphate regulon sensor histidine kinase PhoR